MSELWEKRYPDGSIISSSSDWNEEDYKDSRLYYPCLGVVLAVYPSDHKDNKSARYDAAFRGHYWEADVLIFNNGEECHILVPHVVIAPNGPCGVDDFTQDIPRPTSFLVDGAPYNGSLVGVNLDKLDGDRCLVQFIGGKITQPVMTSWMQHPANRQDPSTSGEALGSLPQGDPSTMRRSGTTVAFTPEGSIFVDTNGANSVVVNSPAGYKREKRETGGDINVDVKPTCFLSIDFNEVVPISGAEPSVLQPNPPPVDNGYGQRSRTDSSLYMDAKTIQAIAGAFVQLASNTGDIWLTPAANLRMGDENSEENMVLGQVWKTKMLEFFSTVSSFMENFLAHTHPTGTGPSGVPTDALTVRDLIDSDMQSLTDTIDDNLSDFIFGSKEAPPPESEDSTEREEETGETA